MFIAFATALSGKNTLLSALRTIGRKYPNMQKTSGDEEHIKEPENIAYTFTLLFDRMIKRRDWMTPFQDYVIAVPAEAQSHLLDILTYIASRFPKAEQRVYHSIPSFFVNGKDILNVGAYKTYIGIHVGYGITDYLKRKYPAYRYTKSTVQFPYTQPMPMYILKDICTAIESSLSNG